MVNSVFYEFINFKLKIKISLFGFFMQSMLSAESTVFAKLQFIRRCPLIFCCRVVSSFAFTASKCNNYSHEQNSFAFRGGFKMFNFEGYAYLVEIKKAIHLRRINPMNTMSILRIKT